MATFVRGYKKKVKSGKVAIVKPYLKGRPRTKGTLWYGEKAIHGPRLIQPKEFKKVWISPLKWPTEKWFTKRQQMTVKVYSKKEGIKLPKDFPKSTKVKVGITKKGKLKPQSFITPVKNFTGTGGDKYKKQKERIKGLVKSQKIGRV